MIFSFLCLEMPSVWTCSIVFAGTEMTLVNLFPESSSLCLVFFFWKIGVAFTVFQISEDYIHIHVPKLIQSTAAEMILFSTG